MQNAGANQNMDPAASKLGKLAKRSHAATRHMPSLSQHRLLAQPRHPL